MLPKALIGQYKENRLHGNLYIEQIYVTYIIKVANEEKNHYYAWVRIIFILFMQKTYSMQIT